ncbi:MAG: hypothetical protein C5B54_02355 [Acidobacteria bacterium]|nr:MAG: hypothetical protein C5B54_02355 [Acidobacteriota bacterium]
MDGGCPIKRGFFTLRACGEPPVRLCPSCSRMVCNQHIATTAASTNCVECATKTRQPDQYTEDSWYDSQTPYSYRNRYYTRYGYTPYYIGYYDDQDFASFDSDASSSDLDDGQHDLMNS